MQFIDQAAAYSQKSISLTKAVDAGRAKLSAAPDAEKLALCFRPALKVASAFDTSIDARLKFFELSTLAKLDLLIEELLPGFFHADLLPLTGRDSWTVRFVIDADVHRTLFMDATGIRAIEDGQDTDPAIELETDVMTLLAILRSVIAEYHLKTPAVTNPSIAELNADKTG